MTEDEQPELYADEEPLPGDQWRACGGCGEAFFSEVQRSRPMLVPLFCGACGARSAAEVRRREERWRERQAAKRQVKLDKKLADALLKKPRKKKALQSAQTAL